MFEDPTKTQPQRPDLSAPEALEPGTGLTQLSAAEKDGHKPVNIVSKHVLFKFSFFRHLNTHGDTSCLTGLNVGAPQLVKEFGLAFGAIQCCCDHSRKPLMATFINTLTVFLFSRMTLDMRGGGGLGRMMCRTPPGNIILRESSISMDCPWIIHRYL